MVEQWSQKGRALSAIAIKTVRFGKRVLELSLFGIYIYTQHLMLCRLIDSHKAGKLAVVLHNRPAKVTLQCTTKY